MNCGLFGVRFSVLWHKKGAVAPVDYLSTFATAPFFIGCDILRFSYIVKTEHNIKKTITHLQN